MTADTYAPPMPDTERITRAQAAEILGVSLGRVDVYMHRGLLDRDRNELTRRVTLDRAQVEALAQKRQGT